MQLEPCSTCRRHIVASARSCPFCGAASSSFVARALHRGRRLSRAAIFAGAASGCWTSAKPPAPPVTNATTAPVSHLGRIEGVVRTSDGAPVSGEQVALSGTATASTTTDANGQYVFENLAPGSYFVALTDNNPRHKPPTKRVEVTADSTAHADSLTTPAPDMSACCKPYGAPPARRRVV